MRVSEIWVIDFPTTFLRTKYRSYTLGPLVGHHVPHPAGYCVHQTCRMDWFLDTGSLKLGHSNTSLHIGLYYVQSIWLLVGPIFKKGEPALNKVSFPLFQNKFAAEPVILIVVVVITIAMTYF